MRKKKGPPLASANTAQLKRLGLKRKHYIFPRDIALAIEAQAEKEKRFETQILVDAFRAYQPTSHESPEREGRDRPGERGGTPGKS